MNTGTIITLCVIGALLIVVFVIIFPGVWFRALISGTYVPIWKVLRIRIKRLDSKAIVMCYIKARKSGVEITIDQIENHAQARGNIDAVVNACIAAVNGDIPLKVKTAMAIDLSGRDIQGAVTGCIRPKVIETLPVSTVCKNGVELTARAKITIKNNLERLIGGALEETIIARVSEGIVTCIGRANDHKELLENPNIIGITLSADKRIEKDSAYDVISIDVSKIEVGRNVGAELAIDEAVSRKIIAQSDAEKRRTEALAAEQEMRARTQAMRARVVAAEALLPHALADALDRGNIGVQDYYGLQNLVSDTEMRKQIAGTATTDMLPAPKKKSKLA